MRIDFIDAYNRTARADFSKARRPINPLFGGD